MNNNIKQDSKQYTDLIDKIKEPILFISAINIMKRPAILIEKLVNSTIIEEKTHKKISIAVRQGKNLWKNTEFELREDTKDYITFRLQDKMIILYPPNEKNNYWLFVEKEKKDLKER